MENRTLKPTEAVELDDRDGRSVIPKPADGRTSILALSGGGSDGAYGVGVLLGWQKSGTRPDFDVVTGVSTGALMAICAFLGPEYDAIMRELYLSQTASTIYTKRGVTALFSDSLYDNTPLKNLIEKVVTPKMLKDIAREHRKGRRLYVGTTNLDANELVVWDMGQLAESGEAGRTDPLQTFQKVLRASAAIPVLFPPVYIKPIRGVQLRQAHADGGVKAPLLVNDFLFASEAPKRDLYVIINGSLALENRNSVVQPKLRDVASHAVTGLTSELTQQTVYRGYVRAQQSGTSFNLTSIPDDIPQIADALAFDQKRINRIYQRGLRDASLPGFWAKEPPTLRRFDKVN